MKTNGLTVFLVGLLLAGSVATASLAYVYVRSMQNVGKLQVQVAVINRDRSLIQSLASEAVDYSKRNPSIEPILQSVGISIKTPLEGPSK
jgi:hypothetical protein